MTELGFKGWVEVCLVAGSVTGRGEQQSRILGKEMSAEKGPGRPHALRL